jgi:hypothetical protein
MRDTEFSITSRVGILSFDLMMQMFRTGMESARLGSGGFRLCNLPAGSPPVPSTTPTQNGLLLININTIGSDPYIRTDI